MKTRFNVLALFLLLGVMVLSACGASAPAATEAPAMGAPMQGVEQPAAVEGFGQADAAKVESAPPADLSSAPVYDTGAAPDANADEASAQPTPPHT